MLSDQLQTLFIQAVKDGTGKELDAIAFEEPKSPEFGDQATNIAMMLSKELGKNPRELAQAIVDALPENDLIDRTDIAGPGFINFWLSEKVFEAAFEDLVEKIQNQSYGRGMKKSEKISVEYSQPNIAKPLGIHHLLSTIIGQSLSNMFEYQQYDVTRTNYIGDWGTQFGKLVYAYKTWGDHDQVEKDPIAELLKLYVHFHEEAEKDETLDDKGRAEFKKLEQGDTENIKLWEWIVEISMSEIQRVYDKLGGVHFDNFHGEAYFKDKTWDSIEDGKKKGLFKEGEEGALLCFFPDEKYVPYMIQKKDGSTLYSTRDLPCIKERDKALGKGKNIYVVDVAQKLYFQQLFETAKLLGYVTKSTPVHVEFGRMSFPDGAMSTRKGKVVLLEDVLDEAEKRALEKIKEHDSKLPDEEQSELAHKIGIGAIKYNVLSQSRTKNYTFDWDIMLSFDGNSAPYLQYAYTRTQSVLRKASSLKLPASSLKLQASEELALLKKLLEYEMQIERSLREYKPNHLCNYLFELAQAFSLFYNNVRILDGSEEEQANRLKLVEAVAYVLKNGLKILGIEVPERM
jgi:arginyl-tRNA synthetase